MKVLIRGGGDLGSGVAVRLHRVGFQVVISEIPNPTVVRRTVSFANAIFENDSSVEGIPGKLVSNPDEIEESLKQGVIPVVIDPEMSLLEQISPDVLIDARMLKKEPEYDINYWKNIIGLGPGFSAGLHCHAVIETNRGHFLGRVIWEGEAEPNTNTPGKVKEFQKERVLRSPSSGKVISTAKIGDFFKLGEIIGSVNGIPFEAPFNGCLRGLVHPSVEVFDGMKIGDLDPRLDRRLTQYVSEKSLAIAGGVLEAILVLNIDE